MNSLFSQRRQRHFMELLKYWRLVFNDHFVIALFFLFGALAYGYSQWLPQLNSHLWWSRWLLVLWFVLITQVGRLATLIKRPDPVFLLPQVTAIKHYLKQATTYSMILGVLMMLELSAVALPFALTTERLTGIDISLILITALITKVTWLWTARKAISIRWGEQYRRTIAEYWVNPLIVWLFTWLVGPVWGLLVSVVLLGAMIAYYRNVAIDWQLAVRAEQDRMYSIYRFFNLFTDVPSVQGNVKRRKWATGLISLLENGNRPWAYLYAHGFIRNTEVSGLVIRLTIVGMLIAFFIPVNWLNTVVVLLFIYLVATQIMPFYEQYQNNVFTHIYPIAHQAQVKDFQRLLSKVIVLEMLLIVLASVGRDLNWQRLILNLILGLGESYLLIKFYFQSRIKK
ncbi:ABC transporter permease [Limosilactobacillus fastidiosus]|uniref:ABC transporter permease n=1 Tax=Limosilactobacillus fastidiosus TaxID=2759855 RepID=A0A7W3U191_9LACO|nr:ABC transporter permease [Limosilactobacillus fastidiosus]MBB1063671.1 ABC transporter permease [Limosilactobacillus fastidiosus]MBB1086800.1 ABC transporter permease [Limosilactobacillus fastidiosus]MCD7084246.1 ABC transporter permease [Limosilactobacillus fastidiosus]MCD7085473.1 ABC transporter permease [Limosilactobacillus fastidiosus]MCD7114704.1 ABC transporter permease [Limosilactobacillus fastidiosus]